MPAKPQPQQIAKEILAALRRLADGELATAAQIFFKEPVRLMGVRAADMHRIARQTYLRVKPHWKLADAAELCEIMLPDPQLELKGVALLVCERFGSEFDPSLLPITQKWIERGDCNSWAVIDTLCPCIIGPLVTRYPELLRQTRLWTKSPNAAVAEFPAKTRP